MHDGNAQLHRSVVEQVTAREVVRSVHDDVPTRQDLEHVVGPEPGVVGDHVDVGIQRRERLLGGVHLAVAHPIDVVENLALQVGLVHHVHVDDAEGADSGGSQIQRGGRAKPACAKHEHLGVEQLELTSLAHLGQQQVPLVPIALLGAERGGRRPWAALVLPAAETAIHGDGVGIAQLRKGLRSER